MSKDAYVASAPVYGLLNASFHPGQATALERLTPLVCAESGLVFGIGAGLGLNTVSVLERLPEARAYALEPNAAMRTLVLTKVTAHPEWLDRVTTRPEASDTAPLPDTISAAILLGMLGYFGPDKWVALSAALAAQLPEGRVALTDLQPPRRPVRVESHETASARIDDLIYSDLAEGQPLDDEHTQQKITCRTLNGDHMLAEETTKYLFCRPDPEVIRTELRTTGLNLNQIEDTIFYLIVKD